jgi:hypothetical protein
LYDVGRRLRYGNGDSLPSLQPCSQGRSRFVEQVLSSASSVSVLRERQLWTPGQRHDDVAEPLGRPLEVLTRRDGGGDGVTLILVSRDHA